MSLIRRMVNGWKNLLGREGVERELEAEVRSVADLLEDEKISAGANPLEARRASRMELGGLEQLKEEVRSVRAGAWFGTLLRDFRFGTRILCKNPGFTVIALIT